MDIAMDSCPYWEIKKPWRCKHIRSQCPLFSIWGIESHNTTTIWLLGVILLELLMQPVICNNNFTTVFIMSVINQTTIRTMKCDAFSINFISQVFLMTQTRWTNITNNFQLKKLLKVYQKWYRCNSGLCTIQNHLPVMANRCDLRYWMLSPI